MKEVQQSLPGDKNSKTVAIVAFAAAAVLGLGFAYQYNRCNELDSALGASQSKIDALTAREKEVASELSKVRTEANSGNEQVAKMRDEIATLTGKLKAKEQQAMANERALQETVFSLRQKELAASARDDSQVKDTPQQNVGVTHPTKRNSATGADETAALLKHFIRTSDEFTRPKIYWHEHFANLGKDPRDTSGVFRFIDLKVDTEGKMTINDFKAIKVLHRDELLCFPDIASFNQFFKSQDIGDTLLKCRLIWVEQDFSSKLPGVPIIDKSVDLLLNKRDLTAFRETFELADSFKRGKSQK